ncbi:MAG TPA: TetR/AcrR family transcriptional regulator [Clostridiales bacterium]|nr:TetR/AcrR family transcriptional regulator [Clostridiales bacterium]
MGNNGYSEKEIAIFNGLIELIRNGANPYSIKVSDIAEASEVGKGTIYDYFKSKEEAISRAILYSINKEAEYAYTRIKSTEKFRDKFYEILHIMAESMENNKSTFNMLIATGSVQEFYEYLVDYECDFSELMEIFNCAIEHLLQTGISEGLIDNNETPYYQAMVVRGTVAAFSGYISHMDWYATTCLEEAMDSAYRMLIKALGC